MFIGVICPSPSGVEVFACWWQKSQMSDGEKIEAGHVMKEPEVQDLENEENITTKWLRKGKEMRVEQRINVDGREKGMKGM